MARMPWCTAAEPVAQAFSTRVVGLKRKAGSACSTSEAVKSCGEKPALKWPSTISSTSAPEMPASASASVATFTTRLSTVSASNFPNGVCAHPTMLAVIVFSLNWSNGVLAYLSAGFSDFMVRSHMAVMPAQLPDLTSAAGQTQDPPTQTTSGSASQDVALASPMPPVGQNLAFGNGPASARSALIPP